VLQAGQQPRIDRLLLIEMEKRDTGVGARHIVARERQGAGVQIADQQRRQQSNTKRAAVPDGSSGPAGARGDGRECVGRVADPEATRRQAILRRAGCQPTHDTRGEWPDAFAPEFILDRCDANECRRTRDDSGDEPAQPRNRLRR